MLRYKAGYLGATEVCSSDRAHCLLYDQSLPLIYHVAGRTLGVLRHEFEADDDLELLTVVLEDLPFDAGRYEDLGSSGTFLDVDFLSQPR